MHKISIIICTANRGAHLCASLASLKRVSVPQDSSCELIIVDNGSVDNTAAIVQSCDIRHMSVRYCLEPHPGLSHARNTGLANSHGDIVIFADDDVRFSVDWIEGMCKPILSDSADAVAGAVVIPSHLEREWMRPTHRGWLASTERLYAQVQAGELVEMVGASMAFSRKVLSDIPEFDVELGSGALGYGEDTLFCFLVKTAGYRIVYAPDVFLEHYFDTSRLQRSSFLTSAEKFGKSTAYIDYHWQHKWVPAPRLRLWAYSGILALRRIISVRESRNGEGCPEWEILLLRRIHYHRFLMTERGRPRKYHKHGLMKLRPTGWSKRDTHSRP
jgi:glycosyltransferase involved in cell wall biosynthesis